MIEGTQWFILPLAHERLDDDGQVIFDLLVEYEGELPFGINQAQKQLKKCSI